MRPRRVRRGNDLAAVAHLDRLVRFNEAPACPPGKSSAVLAERFPDTPLQ